MVKIKSLTSVNLEFGLLSIPIKVYSVRSNGDKVSFKTLSDCCKQESGLKRYCKSCQQDIAWRTNLKGYQISKDQIVRLTKDEIETIEKASSGIRIVEFTKVANIDNNNLDKPYFIEATGNFKLYNLLSDLFSEMSIVAVVKAVLKGSEHIGILKHHKKGLFLQFLEKTTDINIEVSKVEADKDEREMLKGLIKGQINNKFQLNEMNIDYADRLKGLIEKKLRGENIEIVEADIREGKDNLKDSLAKMVEMSKKKVEVVENDVVREH